MQLHTNIGFEMVCFLCFFFLQIFNVCLSQQIKQLDTKLPFELEDILKGNNGLETVVNSDNENAPTTADSIIKNQEQPLVSAKSTEETVVFVTS